MEKLAQLRAEDEWDLIVVDTPPSRSALDFLDAPARLARFLDGRMLRLLTSSSKGGHSMFSLVTSSMSFFTRAVNKVIGGRMLSDIATFAASLDSTFGGFRTRAEATFRALQDQQTAFLVVAAPAPDAIREAVYFTRRLTEERMPLAGMVLNRSHSVEAAGLSAERALGAAEGLDAAGHPGPTADVLRVHARLVSQVETERRIAMRYTAACPEVPQARVPAFAADVHDLEDLRSVAEALVSQSS